MDCRQTILDLVEKKPKHYSKIIKSDSELASWVSTNTLYPAGSWVEQIYSAVYQDTGICPNGNQKKISRWSLGFSGCGPASVCKCTKEKISNGVSSTKQSIPADQVARSNKKRQATMLEKYGAEFNMLRPELASSYSKPKIPFSTYELLNNVEYLDQEYNVKKRSSVDIAAELSVDYSTVLYYCRNHGFKIRKTSQCSLEETQVSNFIQSLGFEVDLGNWDILNGKEIDIVIPDRKIGIEINGLYWHSFHPEKFRKPDSPAKIENRSQHLEKTIEAESLGYQLLHITDHDWREKRSIVESMLRSKLGLNQTVYARKCKLVPAERSTAKTFFNQYHVQGHINAGFYQALTLNDEIVMMVSVGPIRYSKEETEHYELYRVATKPGITVVGGLSKLIKDFQKTFRVPLISYCARDWSTGNGYSQVGGELVGTSDPGYFWTDGTRIINRYQTTKNNLVKLLGADRVDLSKSQADNMFDNGFSRYWDCGNFKFVFKLGKV